MSKDRTDVTILTHVKIKNYKVEKGPSTLTTHSYVSFKAKKVSIGQ